MILQCKDCEDIIFSTPKEPFQMCACGDIMVDGSYNKDGRQLLFRWGCPDLDKPEDYYTVIEQEIQ